MEQTSIEDFQDYHNHQPVGEIDDASIPSIPPSPDHNTDAIEVAREDDEASLSGSGHHSSGADEAVFDYPSGHSSPRTSHGSDDDISIPDSSYEAKSHPTSPFTPLKTRSPFRSPSSVRAMQRDITPPHLTPSSHHRAKVYTPSRQNTPRSLRSHTSTKAHSPLSPTKKLKKEYPLVLLHITLLPPPAYPPHLLSSILPPSTHTNWTLLLEKTTPTIQSRGILIPHPREDYDLLEERLLESLELAQPRILKCGHFHLSPEDEADLLSASDPDPESDGDAETCPDCHFPIHPPYHLSKYKSWSIRLFAANGLMRAGAWGAAWREMERVDVEILPWMDESVRRELEIGMEAEERKRIEEERRKVEEERMKAEEVRLEREEGVGGLDDERLREIYGGTPRRGAIVPDEALNHIAESTNEPQNRRASHEPLTEPAREEEVPLQDLLKTYLRTTAQDPRNIAILALTLFVLYLSLLASSAQPATPSAPAIPSPAIPPQIQTQVSETVAAGAGVLGKVGAGVGNVVGAIGEGLDGVMDEGVGMGVLGGGVEGGREGGREEGGREGGREEGGAEAEERGWVDEVGEMVQEGIEEVMEMVE